jgi:hypothetical protein
MAEGYKGDLGTGPYRLARAEAGAALVRRFG